ncbi:MAG: hypothetical protein VZR31_09010 [Lachnospiraceae bacterium]|nr:hypothetical protein [Lachnospiraceae bacterium]
MKEKYIIRVYLSSFYDVEVEADNLQDAKQQAESSENWDMVEIGNNLVLQDGDPQVLDEYPSITVRTVGVEWDTDGMDEEELDLPSEVEVPSELDDEDVADYLSDTYGFCVKGWYEI